MMDLGVRPAGLDYGAACVDLLLGGTCVGCGRPGRSLCERCAPALATAPVPHSPSPRPPGLPGLYRVAAYDGVARAALVAHKEQGRLSLARPLGRALAGSVLGLVAELPAAVLPPGQPVHLVLAPSRRAVVRARGHDPLLRMTRACVRELGDAGVASVVSPLLRVRRRVLDQSGLDQDSRQANLAAAFSARTLPPRAIGCPVVLVDDIVTTGSTLTEMARAMRAVGADVLGAAVVAATQRRIEVPTASSEGENGKPVTPGVEG